MAKRTPPFKENPEMSEAQFFSLIRSALRRQYIRWKPKTKALHDSRITVTGQGRTKYNYKCSICKEFFKAKQVEVDHIIPCGSLRSFEDIGEFAKRLFVGADKLRVVCKPCHLKITAEERNRKKVTTI